MEYILDISKIADRAEWHGQVIVDADNPLHAIRIIQSDLEAAGIEVVAINPNYPDDPERKS